MTPEEKAEYLQRLGYNPDEYDIVESPEVNAEEAPEPMSVGDAILTRLKRAVVPNATGLAAVAGAAKLPIPHPLLKGAAIVGSGIVGNIAGAFGQEEVLKQVMDEEEYNEGLAEYTRAGEERPILSAVTDMVPSAVALGPNLTGLGALKGARWGGVRDMSNAQKAALGSMAAEGVVGGAVDAGVQKVIEGRDDIDWKRVATSAAGNALMSQPYGPIGNRLFPKGAIIPPQDNPPVPDRFKPPTAVDRSASLEFYDAEASPELPALWQESNKGLMPDATKFDNAEPPSGYRPPVDPVEKASLEFWDNDSIPANAAAAPEWSQFDVVGQPPAGSPVKPSQFDPQAPKTDLPYVKDTGNFTEEDGHRIAKELGTTADNIINVEGYLFNKTAWLENNAKPPEIEIVNPNNMSLGPEMINRLMRVAPRTRIVKTPIGHPQEKIKVGPKELEAQAEAARIAEAQRNKDKIVDQNIPAPALSPKPADTSIGEVKSVEDLDDNMRFQPASRASRQTDTTEFKKWFNGSKVVDKEGKPLRVYHGTTRDFNSFDANAPIATDSGYLGKGFYFSKHPQSANSYAKYPPFTGDDINGANLKPVYLSIKNPVPDNIIAEGHRRFGTTKPKSMTEWFKSQGYDGIVTSSEVVAFEPTQIKSAIGNGGTFDGTNPDIRFQGDSPYANLTPEDLQFAHELAKRRGTTIQEAIGLMTPDGDEAAGMQDMTARTTHLNPEAAGGDTPAHEIAGHQFVKDMLNSTNAKDRLDAQRAIDALGDEETLAQKIGENILRRREKPVRSWLKDFFSLAPDVSMARRAVDRKPFTEDADLMKGALKYMGEDTSDVEFSKTGAGTTTKPLDPINKAFAGIVESLERQGTKEGRHAAKVLSNFETDQTRYIGAYVNKFDQIIRGVKDKAGLLDYLYDMRHTGSSSSKMFNEASPEVKAIREVSKSIHDEQRSLGRKVEQGDGNFRDAQDNPYYVPNMVDPSVIKAISENAPNAAKLKQDYIEFLANKGVADAPKVVQDYLNALGSNTRGTSEFKAITKAEGYGLPKSWVERDLVKLYERYASKVARDFAFYKNVEKDPIARKIFGVDRPGFLKADDVDAWEDGSLINTMLDKDGQAAKARVTGQYTPESPQFRNVERLVRSGLLGTLSAVKNHVAGYIQMQPYIPIKYQGDMIRAWGQIRKGLQDSMDKGVNRWDITSLELGDYLSDRWGQKIANFLRTAQGYKHIEQYTRAHNMMVGELAAENMWINAARGGREELAFFEKFKGNMELDFSKPPSTEQIKEIAANFVERVQGSYNTKGLPSWLTNPSSPWYYIMSLSKWGVERANIIRQDVFTPATKGNYGPLLRYTLGSILGGAAIRGISEMLNNRKQEVPTYGEALASKKGDIEGSFYQTVNLLQMAGFAGIYADLVKMATDAAHGNKPRTPNVVSVDFATDIVKTLGNSMEAISKGEGSVDVVLGAVRNTLTEYIQGLRLIANNTYKAQDHTKADKYRDRRVWERLEDKPRSQASVVESNTLVGGDERRYKQTGDIKEARKILKEELVPKYRGLNASDRSMKLDSLRRNSYQVLPSEPRDLKEYLSYIEASQGKEARQDLVKSTAKQKAVNKAKSQMVPQR